MFTVTKEEFESWQQAAQAGIQNNLGPTPESYTHFMRGYTSFMKRYRRKLAEAQKREVPLWEKLYDRHRARRDKLDLLVEDSIVAEWVAAGESQIEMQKGHVMADIMTRLVSRGRDMQSVIDEFNSASSQDEIIDRYGPDILAES